MSIMYLLVPLALLLAGLAVVAFVWSARQGQLDDLVTPALRILHDDERLEPRQSTPRKPATASIDSADSAPTGERLE
jgi:cbb3-type cytochrome oxidase maturation protein